MSSVRCQFCSSTNPADAKFCASCSMQFRRHRITAACTALFLVIGMLVLWPTHDPVHVISPVLSALPSEAAAPDDRRAPAQRAVYIESEPMPVLKSVAGATPESMTKNGDTCTAGLVALGLCPSELEPTQAAAQISSQNDAAHPSTKEHALVRCNEAAVALGLCEQ